MALGFGFNKTKVLAAAEKFVQQGKLQNAIAEYEKVIKDDPKDLTVLNAIGDLYARVGQNEKAYEYFKKVGDQYAQNGFTVKAIAVYKKVTRLGTGNDATIRLAELYTQQGLFNDARTHYMQVADQLLKSGDNNQAAKILQKILELDPENTTTQSKLAELFIKLGKKEEARTIYYSAAESLYARKAFDAADEALSRVLSLEPANHQAQLLRGMIASDSGDTASAIQYLEQVPDIDSHPEALRALVRAKLQANKPEGTETLALKLFTVHQDLSGIASLAEWLGTHNQEEEALKLYDRYADRFFAQGSTALAGTLYPLISRIRTNLPALEQMLRLLHKAGDTSQLNEVMELLAHAKVQSGDFVAARDLYKELSDLEPENPLHAQNYKQMLSRLGEDTMSRPLTMEESGQALMVEELEYTAPTVHQEYTPGVEKAIEAALTDAELYISYNVPLKGIAPLEAVLPAAPRDLRLNQRLASLYLRAGRYADAVKTCKLLSELFAEFGHQTESERYAEEALKYKARAAEESPVAETVAVAPVVEVEPEPPPAEEAQPVVPESATSTVRELVLDVPEEFFEAPVAEVPASQQETAAQEPVLNEFMVEPAEPAAESAGEPAAEAETPAALPQEIEIDVSQEWESMLTAEPEPSPAQPPAPETIAPQPEPVAETPAEPVAETPAPVAAEPDTTIEDKIQEIRFYISQGFWDMARAATHDLSEMDPENSALQELKTTIAVGEAAAVAAAEPPQVIAQGPTTPPVESHVADEEIVLELQEEPPPVAKAGSAAANAPAEQLRAQEPQEDILEEMVSDLEESLGSDFLPGGSPPQHTASVPVSRPAATGVPAASNGGMLDPESTSILSNILSELQHDLGEETTEAEDPETHYNLGIAFKEMGLLDEAIGELQKVCHAVEVGSSFSQPVQAYTWLAQCLVDKGVPEAAVRWYQKALQLPGLDHTSRCAIYYDLGSAYEASGDRKSALANFMEVYSSNIDFRDVASRIKVLKS